MLSQNLLNSIAASAREFNVGAVWLFGSAMGEEAAAHDIDLAVEGLAPTKFFAFYARLIRDIPKPVDLVDLSLNPPIRHVIRSKGVLREFGISQSTATSNIQHRTSNVESTADWPSSVPSASRSTFAVGRSMSEVHSWYVGNCRVPYL